MTIPPRTFTSSLTRVLLGLVLTLGLSTTLQAAPILIGSVSKDYGTGPGQVGWAGGSGGTCDTLNANSITIRDSSGCQRFWDTFNFSALDYDSIDHFQLTLTYSDISGPGICAFGSCTGERWAIRPAQSGSTATDNLSGHLSQVGATPTTTTFTISNSNYADVFNTIVNQGVFHLWFAESSLGNDNFNLYSASLNVFGTAPVAQATVPEPGMLGLLALGLLGLARVRRLRGV